MENEIEISARAEAFYVVTRRWLSDLEFFKIETNFLHHLQQEYFKRSTDQPTIEKLKVIGNELTRMQVNMESAGSFLIAQIKSIDAVAENIVSEDIEALNVTQLTIANSMTKLIDEYRWLKKQLFILVETRMRAEKTGLFE